MKHIFVALALTLSLSSFADTSVKGAIELKQYEAVENTTYLTITGDVAVKIWNDMKPVDILPADQYQPHDIKMGEGIYCGKTKTKIVQCFVQLDSLTGKINIK